MLLLSPTNSRQLNAIAVDIQSTGLRHANAVQHESHRIVYQRRRRMVCRIARGPDAPPEGSCYRYAPVFCPTCGECSLLRRVGFRDH